MAFGAPTVFCRRVGWVGGCGCSGVPKWRLRLPPMLPRTLLRRETRNKWTLRARARHPRARWRGPTAPTWLRTPKAPSRLCLLPLRPSIAAHVFISPEFLFMLSCVPAVASGPSSQRHVCPWCPCLPQTPHPGCRGSVGPGTHPGLLWGVHLAWVSPNLGHADPLLTLRPGRAPLSVPIKGSFPTPPGVFAQSTRAVMPEDGALRSSPHPSCAPGLAAGPPSCPRCGAGAHGPFIQHSWGWREAHQQLPWGVTAEEEERLGCSHFALHPPGWAQPAFHPHLCALHRLFPKCPIRTIQS